MNVPDELVAYWEGMAERFPKAEWEVREVDGLPYLYATSATDEACCPVPVVPWEQMQPWLGWIDSMASDLAVAVGALIPLTQSTAKEIRCACTYSVWQDNGEPFMVAGTQLLVTRALVGEILIGESWPNGYRGRLKVESIGIPCPIHKA